MRDTLLRALGLALDGLEVGFCAFDASDKTIAWNATFLALFPEHDGNVFKGEPYENNLRRFYTQRLGVDDLPSIDRYMAEGVARHRSQRRPYEFDHHDYRVRVSSIEMGSFGRIRVWRKVAQLPTRVLQPVSSTLALAELDARAVLERLGDGVMVLDVADRVMWANEAFLHIYGVRSQDSFKGRTFEEIYRAAWRESDDGIDVSAHLFRLQDSQRYPGVPFELALPDDRTVRVVAQRGEVDGRGYYVHVDITHLKRQQDELARAESRYRLLAEYSSDVIVALERGFVSYASPGVTRLLGWDPAEVQGGHLVRYCHPEDVPFVVSALRSLQSQPEADYRARALHKDGSYVWVEARAMRIPNGRSLGRSTRVLNLRGIKARKAIEDEQERITQRLEAMAVTDALTGLANRHKLELSLASAVHRSGRDGSSLGIVVVDIDHFKQLNDDYGHLFGDAVLRQFGLILASFAHRAGDIAARLGGEEFLLMLPGVDSTKAQALAENIRAAVEQTSFGKEGRTAITVSIGVASAICATREDAEQLIALADDALYAAKRAGRNRVHVAHVSDKNAV